jgi:exodeoxyribonuclease VII large subunit
VNTGSSRPEPLTITALTRQVKDHLEGRFRDLWVMGEISNFKRYSSGHCYFSLKDAGAQLSCVLWRGNAEQLRFQPADGQHVVAWGRVSVYEPRGQYQFVADFLELAGLGALAAAFEALKKKLDAEGLFAAERKRPIPSFPRTIGIVTSPTGAAVRDLLKVILGRWPRIEILLAPVRVQGEGAAREIAEAIGMVNRHGRADVMIVGRGGGSLEDLWAFNEEVVARAIAASRIPVISAVGHEIDFTIADFVADLRAATPSHAGELVVPERAAVDRELARAADALPRALLRRVAQDREQLRALASNWALRSPLERITQLRQRLDELQERVQPLGAEAITRRREHLGMCAAQLEGLSPLRVLDRGFSVTVLDDGTVVRDARQVKPGERVMTRLRKGRVRSRVEDIVE